MKQAPQQHLPCGAMQPSRLHFAHMLWSLSARMAGLHACRPDALRCWLCKACLARHRGARHSLRAAVLCSHMHSSWAPASGTALQHRGATRAAPCCVCGLRPGASQDAAADSGSTGPRNSALPAPFRAPQAALIVQDCSQTIAVGGGLRAPCSPHRQPHPEVGAPHSLRCRLLMLALTQAGGCREWTTSRP